MNSIFKEGVFFVLADLQVFNYRRAKDAPYFYAKEPKKILQEISGYLTPLQKYECQYGNYRSPRLFYNGDTI